MKTRLRKVEHIVVFDTFDGMVAGPKEEPFWYKYQKEVFLGDKKIREKTYDSRPKRVGMKTNQLDTLKRRVNRMLNENPFCWTDVEDQPEWVDVNIRGGSTISYMGDNRQKFLKKVLGVEDGTR